jgi:hypothetical protein
MRTALYKPKFFNMRYVPHSEFQALQRFPDYKLLIDGTLSRVEPGGFEYRVIDETAKRHFPIGVLTTALQKELHEYYRQRWREKQNANYSNAAPLDISVTPVADERSQPEPPAPT